MEPNHVYILSDQNTYPTSRLVGGPNMSAKHSNPDTRLPRTTAFPPRAQTEPNHRGGFMRSVMQHRDLDDVDDGILLMSQPERKITQEQQDAADEKARKKAMTNLVNSWQERLQLISVITTFFASTEAAMLVNTKPDPTVFDNSALKASNACLLGALIVHVYAAVLSFLGAFLLIRYKLKEATREEMIVEGMKLATSPVAGSITKDVEQQPMYSIDPIDLGLQQTNTIDTVPPTSKATNFATPRTIPEHIKKGSYVEPPVIYSTNPHLEQVGPFMSNVSSHLLSRTHGLCVLLAAIGFVLAIVGILCYAWAVQPREVCIFASACLGGAVLAMAVLLLPSVR